MASIMSQTLRLMSKLPTPIFTQSDFPKAKIRSGTMNAKFKIEKMRKAISKADPNSKEPSDFGAGNTCSGLLF